jgi:hypothetical protein
MVQYFEIGIWSIHQCESDPLDANALTEP